MLQTSSFISSVLCLYLVPCLATLASFFDRPLFGTLFGSGNVFCLCLSAFVNATVFDFAVCLSVYLSACQVILGVCKIILHFCWSVTRSVKSLVSMPGPSLVKCVQIKDRMSKKIVLYIS